jgi:hypothetical protein
MTRRYFLAGLPLPLLSLDAAAPNSASVTMLPEDHLLSQESAAAYSALLAPLSPPRRSILVLPGAKRLSLARALALRREIEAGSSVLIECGLAFSKASEIEDQRRVLHHAFGIQLARPIDSADPHRPYVAFAPGHLVRSFGLTFPVFSNYGEPLAYFDERPVALKTRLGKGSVVFLGAMLGPHVQASDPDGRFAAQNILKNLIS